MKILIVIIMSLALATAIGLVSLDDPGLMVLSYGQNSWELPLVLGVLLVLVAFALLYLLFNFLFGLLRTPKKVKSWNQKRQNKNAQNATLRGYARLIEGDWAQSEKDLVKRLAHSKTPMLNYLGAAYAAQQQKNYPKRDEYLAMAEKSDPKNRMAVDITRARMLTQAGDYETAKILLDEMYSHAPANKTILRLKMDVHKHTEDWAGVKALLPKLNKAKALPQEQLLALDVAARESSLNESVTDINTPSTEAQYKTLPRKRKQDAHMAAIYASKLIAEGELATAEGVVRKAIKRNWTSELSRLYGQTRTENLLRQINFAITILKDHEDDANVHLCLARLNQAHGQPNKASEYYQKAIALGAGEDACYELGQYHESKGNEDLALACYKQGVQFALDDHSVIALPGSQVQPSASLESIVMPGAGEVTNAVVVNESNSEADIMSADSDSPRVIEHKKQGYSQ